MADCNFSIPFSGDPQQVLNKARGAVQGQGGTLTGDDANGQFQLSVFGSNIAGNYAVVGNELQIRVTDKPFMIPCSTIESFLSKQLGS
jgi:hypothetical protein